MFVISDEVAVLLTTVINVSHEKHHVFLIIKFLPITVHPLFIAVGLAFMTPIGLILEFHLKRQGQMESLQPPTTSHNITGIFNGQSCRQTIQYWHSLKSTGQN